ncbi:MAG: SUMF1/EgtB/PvdO family nonheme iron enzyme, partial [Verrucomicrobiota bacterium]
IKRVLEPRLAEAPRVFHEIEGPEGMYGTTSAGRSKTEPYQYVRLAAVYDEPNSDMAWSNTNNQDQKTEAVDTDEPALPPSPSAPASYHQDEDSRATAHTTPTVDPVKLHPPLVISESQPNRKYITSTVATPEQTQETDRDFPSATTDQQVEPVRKNSLDMRLVYIPPGTFLMGSPKDELGRDEDELLHEVTLSSGFYMQTTEVTQGQWLEVMGNNPSHFENGGMDNPVESVSWVDAQEFIANLNEMHDTSRYRLPTESEWEYACRAGSESAFYEAAMQLGECGYNEQLDQIGWYYGNSDKGPHPVAMKAPNAWGLYDMHGNVWEWCSDREGKYPFSHQTDPQGPSTGLARSRRGGSWSHYPMFCRAANRSWFNPNDDAPNLGFRVAMDVNEPEQAAAPEPEERSAPPADTDDCEVRTRENGELLVRRGIPDARAGAGAVSVERVVPAETKVGEPMSYRLILRNLTECEIIQVTLIEHPDRNFRVTDTEPEAETRSDRSLRWLVRPLEAGGTREFVVTGNARTDGKLEHCATADYRLKICTTTQAVSPRLEITADSPDNALVCDQIPITVSVSNPGSGVAEDVKVTVELGDGLVAEDGQKTVELTADDLGIEQSRQFRVNARPQRAGTLSATATATASGDLRAEDSTRTTVTAPALDLTKSGPAVRYVGRPAQYTIRVTNDGDAPAENTVVRDIVPDGMDVLELSDNGETSNSGAEWKLDTLQPGASKRLSIRLMPRDPGTFTNTARASATCAEDVEATTKTRVAGIAAILLEVSDETDPLEVGGTGTYRIVATNQGSAPSTNLKITCALEENVEYVSSSGPTRATVQNGGVHFNDLDVLEAGQRATWIVRVKAVKEGDVRFRAMLESDQLTRPVEETEATTIY